MKVVLTARRLRPGHYDAFRAAWEPDEMPKGFRRGYILRDPADHDVVVTFGIFDVTDEEARGLKAEHAPAEASRHARIEPHVQETLVSGFFEVVHTEKGSATGDSAFVPLTERHIVAGHADAYMDAARRSLEAAGGVPAGIMAIYALQDVADPHHMIQLGIVRTDDLAEMRAGSADAYEAMLAAIGPHVERTGLDATYELVEEVVPAHA